MSDADVDADDATAETDAAPGVGPVKCDPRLGEVDASTDASKDCPDGDICGRYGGVLGWHCCDLQSMTTECVP